MKEYMMKNYLKMIVVLVFLMQTAAFGEGFLSVSGQKIVTGSNKEVILRGMGIGGWMLPEGYMLQTSSFANAPWEIEKKIVDLVGVQNADSFWSAYRKNFVQRKDIEQLAQLGFNSVRLPMHYKRYMKDTVSGYVWLNEGFAMTDSLLRWCAENSIYLILDLHGAPGGQSANNISDYNPSFPSLWDSESNKAKTIDLWKKLAERYKNEPWIGGYDILNEPAWNLPPSNKPLRDLSVAITTAIRLVDTNHIVFVEGNWYATDFNGMTPAWDNNMVWSFHKYWNSNDAGSINYLLSLRETTNRPLWLGESGENSNTWFTDCISLLESNSIGWAWWTIKKFYTINGPYNVPLTAEYEYLLKYWKGQVSAPTVEYAMRGLLGMAEGLKLENCAYNAGVVDAMMRQPFDESTKPFIQNTIPGTIFLVNYDIGKNGIAYRDNDYHSTSQGSAWNNGWVYRNDGVDIEKCSDGVTNGFNVGWTGTGEYLSYTVDVQDSGNYSISLRAAANDAGGAVGVSWDGKDQTITSLPQTGGWQTWTNVPLGSVSLTAGSHKMKVALFFGGFNLNYISLTYTGPMTASDISKLPEQFSLKQNFPNPCNPTTNITFSIPSNGMVTLTVTDILGKEISQLVNNDLIAGNYTAVFDATNIAGGVYFYTLSAGQFQETKKLTVIK